MPLAADRHSALRVAIGVSLAAYGIVGLALGPGGPQPGPLPHVLSAEAAGGWSALLGWATRVLAESGPYVNWVAKIVLVVGGIIVIFRRSPTIGLLVATLAVCCALDALAARSPAAGRALAWTDRIDRRHLGTAEWVAIFASGLAVLYEAATIIWLRGKLRRLTREAEARAAEEARAMPGFPSSR